MNTDTQAVRRTAHPMSDQKDKLAADIRTTVDDAETLLKQAGSTATEGYAAVRAELADKLADAVLRLQEVQEELKFRARHAARAADDYVHDNPWKSLGLAAAMGIVLGLVLSRR